MTWCLGFAGCICANLACNMTAQKSFISGLLPVLWLGCGLDGSLESDLSDVQSIATFILRRTHEIGDFKIITKMPTKSCGGKSLLKRKISTYLSLATAGSFFLHHHPLTVPALLGGCCFCSTNLQTEKLRTGKSGILTLQDSTRTNSILKLGSYHLKQTDLDY